MRDLVAVAVVVALVVTALRMATALQGHRRRRERRREQLGRQGRKILVEVPVAGGIEFFSEDADAFYWADRRIPKREIRAARLLFNDAPLSTARARRFAAPAAAGDGPTPAPETFERDRWDVAVETAEGAVVVPCGSIREHVSQDLARRIFDAVRRAVEAHGRGDHHSDS